MAYTIAAAVRLTCKASAVWRECSRCGALAPLAPDAHHCRSCRAETHRGRR